MYFVIILQICASCSAGHAHSLILTSNGKVWACGSSVFGQLGTGSNAKSSSPVQIYGLPEKIISVSTAYFHNVCNFIMEFNQISESIVTECVCVSVCLFCL